MKKANILVIGGNPEILEIVVRLVNAVPEWSAKGTGSAQQAVDLFCSELFDLVLLGGAVTEAAEGFIRSSCEAHQPGVKIVQHYGGGSGLLKNELIEALSD